MEAFGIFGVIALLYTISIASKCAKLSNEINRLKKKINSMKKGASEMSKIIMELKNQRCEITFDELFDLSSTKIICDIIDVDEEWIKFRYMNKKEESITKIVRIDKITEVRVL